MVLGAIQMSCKCNSWSEQFYKNGTLAHPYFFIFVPGKGLCSEDEPVVLGASLHDANVDCQPASTDNLCMRHKHFMTTV